MQRIRVRRIAAAAAVVTALVLVTTGCTARASVDPAPTTSTAHALAKSVTADLRSAMKDGVKLAGASGGIVGVWAPWAGSFTEAIGTTRLHGNTPMTTDMTFRIGTVTRAMTCTVLLGLVDDGKVELTDPVTKYLPRMVGVDGITLRQLCQSTSGLHEYAGPVRAQFVNNPVRYWPTLELISDGLSEGLDAEPGEEYAENSAGYVLLGVALQHATGKDWSELLSHYVFSPLHMSSSSLPGGEKTGFAGPHPHGYARPLQSDASAQCSAKLVDVTRLNASVGFTDAGVVSNLDDLHAFARALAGGSLLQPQTSAAQWKTVGMGDDAPGWRKYGLGASEYGRMRGSAGEIPGYLTAMMSDPKSGLTVVVMLNNSQAGSEFVAQLAMQLVSIASKAPTGGGAAGAGAGKRLSITLPWSAEQAASAMEDAAVCPPKSDSGSDSGTSSDSSKKSDKD